MNGFMCVVAFNKELEALVEMVLSKFPDDTGVQQTKAKIDMACQLTPKKPAIGFMTYATRYQKQLKARDDAFFLEQGMQSPDLAHLTLNSKWSAFNDSERKEMWDRVSLMNDLGQRIILSA